MSYNKYVAYGFAMGQIVNSEPHRSIVEAAKQYFDENPREEICKVKRVRVSMGHTYNDPDFEIRHATRKNLLDKLKRV